MPGATARYAPMPATAVTPGEALQAIALASRRISMLSAKDAGCAEILARLSIQLAEATQAVENDAARQIAVSDVYAAGQASRPPGWCHLAPVPQLRESAPPPPAPSPAP